MKIEAAVHAAIASLRPETVVFIGFSGGLDSTVLAHAIANNRGAAQRHFTLVHVNHQLHDQADKWAEHCQAVANKLELNLQVQRVDLDRATPGLENSARRARYQAIAALMPSDAVLLTAHHQQDQAETVLMRMLSGAGPRGASAIRAQSQIFGMNVLRPLLQVSKADLLRYAQAHQLHWVEDPSNANLQFTRNRIRRWLQEIQNEFPGASAALSTFAIQAQRDQALLEHFAQSALARAQTLDTDGGGVSKLCVATIQSETADLRPWIMRAWLKTQNIHAPELMHAGLALCHQGTDRGEARVRLAHRVPEAYACIRRFNGKLYLSIEGKRDLKLDKNIVWNTQNAECSLPTGFSSLRLERLDGNTITQTSLSLELNIRQRIGGERIRLPGRSHTHALKDHLQQLKIPPWQRNRLILLIFSDTNEVAAIVGSSISARFAALLSEHELRLVPNQS
jgi:tRNA(Ile)-lysidine synthase